MCSMDACREGLCESSWEVQNVHWKTESHLELSARGTTSVNTLISLCSLIPSFSIQISLEIPPAISSSHHQTTTTTTNASLPRPETKASKGNNLRDLCHFDGVVYKSRMYFWLLMEISLCRREIPSCVGSLKRAREKVLRPDWEGSSTATLLISHFSG